MLKNIGVIFSICIMIVVLISGTIVNLLNGFSWGFEGAMIMVSISFGISVFGAYSFGVNVSRDENFFKGFDIGFEQGKRRGYNDGFFEGIETGIEMGRKMKTEEDLHYIEGENQKAVDEEEDTIDIEAEVE